VARAAAAAALADDADGARLNQYTLASGLPALNAAIADYYAALYGWRLDPATEARARAARRRMRAEAHTHTRAQRAAATGTRLRSLLHPPCVQVLVTTSATEGLYACMQAFLDPGDEVICFEPVFPWYVSHARLAGATPVPVRLSPPHFALDAAALAAAFTPRTKALVFNSPHNPSGHVATREECEIIAALCVQHNVLVLSDEVYERKVFGGRREVRLADFPGMRERTLTVGTSSKLFSLTGWRVGWLLGPAALLSGVRTLRSYSTFCAPTPLQAGVAAALRHAAEEHAAAQARSDDASGRDNDAGPGPDASSAAFERNAAVLAAALTDVGLQVMPAEGGYFLVVDCAATGLNAGDYCKALIAAARVAAVPMDCFYFDERPEAAPPASLVRFALCKRAETIDAAAAAIRAAPVPLLRGA
jgi:N-succinyldiaminopimelate aminotransferase